MLAVRCRTGKSGTMSIHRPRDRCRHTPPPEPLWRLLHHRPQRLHALVRRALASSMIAIETVDRGRRLVCGQALQPERRYRRCLRDDPHMPRQASPVPAGSHEPPTCFSALCEPHWGASRACHGRTWSQDRQHRSFSLVLGGFRIFRILYPGDPLP